MAEEVHKPPPGTRWELLSLEDGTGSWSWRQIGADGAILQASEPRANFGKAIHDALAHGFSPAVDHWVIKSGGWITHFAPATPPITIAPDDQVIKQPEAAPRRPPESGVRTPVDGSAPPHKPGER